jgi:hypothetical protein
MASLHNGSSIPLASVRLTNQGLLNSRNESDAFCMTWQQESVFFVDALGAFFIWVSGQALAFSAGGCGLQSHCEVFCLLAAERNLKRINFL